jgi:magnesium-transporting ATPase (P-type)
MLAFGVPAKKLTKKRPPENFLSGLQLLSSYGAIIFTSIGTVIAFYLLQQQTWYVPFTDLASDGFEHLTVSPQQTILFFIACLSYCMLAVVVTYSAPFKRFFIFNKPLMVWLVLSFGLISWGFLSKATCPIDFHTDSKVENGLSSILYPMMLGVGLVMYIFENFVVRTFLK